MDAVLLELVTVARRAGVRIGTSEVLDAERAAALVGLGEREVLRVALASTLCKRAEERAVFDRVFDAFFRVDAGGRRGVLDRMRAEGALDAEITASEAALAAMQAAAPGTGGGGLAALAEGGAELDRRIEQALRDADVSAMQSAMQVGLFALRVLEALGVDEMEAELARRRGQLPSGLTDALAAQLEALRRRVRARLRDELERQNPDRLARGRAARLERTALAALDRGEVEQVRHEVERLGRLLRDKIERRRRRTRRGRLDVRATARASLGTGGIPFRPVFRRRRRDRPELVVVCDISDSVRAAARFLLVLVHAMQSAFARTRSFVFVRDVGEVTELFDAHPVEEAVAIAFRGDWVDVGANSDYGRALGQLAARHLGAINRRTTVVILGDARTNQLDPNVRALERIRRRAARVIWFNPEPEGSWGFGDSEMQRYRAWCSSVATVRTLADLREAMGTLAASLTR